MDLGALVGGLFESVGAGGPPVVLSRTSFTMSAGDLNTKGGSGEKDSFLDKCLLLGGL